MEALIRHQQKSECLHTTSIVISDRTNASGLSKAEALGVNAIAIPLPDIAGKLERRIAHENEVAKVLLNSDIEVIILSGYMRILTPSFVKP